MCWYINIEIKQKYIICEIIKNQNVVLSPDVHFHFSINSLFSAEFKHNEIQKINNNNKITNKFLDKEKIDVIIKETEKIYMTISVDKEPTLFLVL